MSYLKFDVQIDLHVTREGDPNDEWDRDSTDGDVTVVGCRRVTEDGYKVLQTSFDVSPFDDVWLVWAQYSTGDSFGSYGGQYELLAVLATEQEAENSVQHFGQVTDYSAPWNGYFESLDFIKHERFVVS